MRQLLCSMLLSALLIAQVAATAEPVEGRAPDYLKKWGCEFDLMGFDVNMDSAPKAWFGHFVIQCDRTRLLDVTATMFEHRANAPNKAVGRLRIEGRIDRVGTYFTTVGGECRRDAEPPRDPFYFKVKVKRFWKPGTLTLASSNVRTPCPEGYWAIGTGEVYKRTIGPKKYFGPPLVKR